MKLGYVIVYVDDVRETMAFYVKAFDLKIRMEFEEGGSVSYGELETEGAVLGFASHQMGEMNLGGRYRKTSLSEEPFGQEIAFVTETVQETYDRAVAAGAVAVSPPERKSWGQTVAYLRAVEGTLIEICSPMGG